MTKIHEGFEWTVDIDQSGELNYHDQPTLILFIINEETGEPINAIGGIDVDYTVSDHGNIHIHPDHEPYIVDLANAYIEDALEEAA
jgi:hypothetical protein